MPTLYQLTNLTKTYNGRAVLEIDDLTIQRGEILALVGPSGAGKSTLLRLLNFLEPPTTGALTFNDHAVSANPSLDLLRRVTTVFQRPVLLSRSVKENVAFGLQLRGHQSDDGVDRTLERVGLTGLASAAASILSGGEMQRVALARALVLNPEVLLLDEATANLDPYNVGLIEKIIVEQNQVHGTSIVLVTHNIFQARRLAHRTGLLLGGKLIELAETNQFFQEPNDPRTRSFVNGEMAY